MTLQVLPFIASGLCLLLGLTAIFLRPKALVSWCFFVGMFLLAAERILDQRILEADHVDAVRHWFSRAMWVNSLIPFCWLAFSLVYARGNATEFLRRWKWILVGAALVPLVLMLGVAGPLVEQSVSGKSGMIRFLGAG
jgi:hypothetical protein